MTTVAQFSINLLQRPSYCFSNLSSRKILICSSWNKLGGFKESKNGILMKEERWGCEKIVKAGDFREKYSFLIGKNGGFMKEKRKFFVKLGAFREKGSYLTGKNGILMEEERRGCEKGRRFVKAGAFREKDSFLIGKNGIFVKEKRMVLVKFKQGFGFDGIGDGGGGGGGRDNSETVRVLSNLVLAIGLTYLTMTGQLGWVLDAIVSVWILAVLLPILGLGAFIWWAGRDIVQGTCPNCGNDFQIFKSTLNDEVQLCPFCTQPFSVAGNKFVRDPVTFSNQSNTFGQAFSDFSTSKKGKESSIGVVDIEAEVKDVD
ncbi:hypothetical protein P3S68_005123 [Capsicum galapagoense]